MNRTGTIRIKLDSRQHPYQVPGTRYRKVNPPAKRSERIPVPGTWYPVHYRYPVLAPGTCTGYRYKVPCYNHTRTRYHHYTRGAKCQMLHYRCRCMYSYRAPGTRYHSCKIKSAAGEGVRVLLVYGYSISIQIEIDNFFAAYYFA